HLFWEVILRFVEQHAVVDISEMYALDNIGNRRIQQLPRFIEGRRYFHNDPMFLQECGLPPTKGSHAFSRYLIRFDTCAHELLQSPGEHQEHEVWMACFAEIAGT